MKGEKSHALGAVVFFRRTGDGTYKDMGRTQPMRYFDALNVYANTPNPASQLVGGDTPEEVEKEVETIIKQMACKKYVEEYVDPYL